MFSSKTIFFRNFGIFDENIFFQKKSKFSNFRKFFWKIFFSSKISKFRKIIFFEEKNLKKNRSQILKIDFRHEQLIFFVQDFFPGKVWLWRFDFWPLREQSVIMQRKARGNVPKTLDFGSYHDLCSEGFICSVFVLFSKSPAARGGACEPRSHMCAPLPPPP